MKKWELPYMGSACTKSQARGLPGVYLIREKNTKVLRYVGMSKTCVYKALYRHFQSWTDDTQHRNIYNKNDYEVRILLLKDINDVDYVERRMIEFFDPPDNRMFYKKWVRRKLKEKVKDLPF